MPTMEPYENLEMETVAFDAEDVIVTSGDVPLPIDPTIPTQG